MAIRFVVVVVREMRELYSRDRYLMFSIGGNKYLTEYRALSCCSCTYYLQSPLQPDSHMHSNITFFNTTNDFFFIHLFKSLWIQSHFIIIIIFLC